VNRVAPLVSVIIPCRNEQDYIESCVRSVLSQESSGGGLEVIVADGMSDDGTREALRRLAQDYTNLRVLDNHEKIVSHGLNSAVREARGSIIVRVDVHTAYAPDYVRECVAVLNESGAENVGGPWRAVGDGYIGRAIAAVFHSPFGSGGARAHDTKYEGKVDTVYLGCWRKSTLERIGGFDEELVRNQDDELNLRLHRAGGTIWQSTRIRSWYSPRNSLRELFRQYSQYGYWKVRVMQKHRVAASWRHLVPAAFVLTVCVLIAASPFSSKAGIALAFVVGAYSISTMGASVVTAVSNDMGLLPVLPLVFGCFHLGYGYGFLRGILDFMIRRRAPAKQMSTLSRSPRSEL
jgi:succinoglycan biosynthesis protein ExoA